MPDAGHAPPVGRRAAAAAATRRDLLDAGRRLAATTVLSELSVNQIVAEAGVAKGTFFHQFGDRTSFLLELHRDFHDELDRRVLQAIEGLLPGRDRLALGTTAYLDGCLRNPAVRALLVDARAEPAILAEIEVRNERTAALARPDFAALSRPAPREAALLWVQLAAEVAVLESGAQRRRPSLRKALLGFLGD